MTTTLESGAPLLTPLISEQPKLGSQRYYPFGPPRIQASPAGPRQVVLGDGPSLRGHNTDNHVGPGHLPAGMPPFSRKHDRVIRIEAPISATCVFARCVSLGYRHTFSPLRALSVSRRAAH